MTAHLGVQIRRAGNHLLSAQEADSHGWFSGSIQIGPQGAAHAGICCHRASLVGATLCVMLALGGCNHFRDNYSNVGPTPPFATPEPPRQTGEPRVLTTERPHRAAGGDILPARADSIPFSRSGGGGTTGPGESVGDAPRQSASLPEPLPEPTATLLPEPPAPVGPPTSSPAFPSNLRLSFTVQNGSPYSAPASRSPRLLNQAVGTGTSTVGCDCSLGRPTSICCCLWVGNEDEMQSLWCGTTTQSGSTSQPNEPANANLPTLGGKSEAFDDLGTGQRGEHSTR
ncbi:MAG: hypothetical protein JWM45_3594 [Pseudonocardiales bacterium]|nr:hypothetical protein [Pseudonocardiales bacterium]